MRLLQTERLCVFVSGSGLIDVWDSVGEIGRKSMFEEEKKEVKNETTSLWCVCLDIYWKELGWDE